MEIGLLHYEEMDLLLENKDKLWTSIKNQNISYEDFEQFIYSDSFLKACDTFDFTYNKSIYRDNWKIYEFNSPKNHKISNVFFQNFLEGEISKSLYYKCENETIEFLRELYGSDCYAFYEFNSDSLDINYPAQQSKNVLRSWNFINKNRAAFTKIRDVSIYQEISYLGIREIALVYFIFTNRKIIAIPNECKCIILAEQPLLNSFLNALDKSILSGGE